MKFDNSKLLTKLANVAGVAGISLLLGLSAEAKETLNPNPSIFEEAPYNRNTRVRKDSQSFQSEQVLTKGNKESTKGNISRGVILAQNSGSSLNPRPSIYDECPYNRAACGNSTPDTPSATPPSIPSEIPETTPTPPPETAPTPPETPPETAPETIPTPPSETPEASGNNILAVAEANGSFNTLTQALKAAGLDQTLQGDGPFTVFAPTDEAFAKLPQDAVRDLLKPENKEVLVKILTYHVVPNKVLSSDLKSGPITSVEGGAINVNVDSEKGVMVNDVKVTTPDVEASNGVIHVIDELMLPPDL